MVEVGQYKRVDNSQIGKLLRGSIDMHIHCGPDIVPRRQDALETALAAREMGLRGIVLKNHSYPTAPIASLVSNLVPDIAIFGGIILDYWFGGLSAQAVEVASKAGAKIVWMPVFCARNSKHLLQRRSGIDIKGDGISILGTEGKLVPEIDEILKVIRDYDMILATGHISAKEIIALVDRAKQLGLTKIVVTHAMSSILSESILKPEERQMLAKEGVMIEHTASEISPAIARADPAEIAAAIKSEGPDNCIMSTDFGQIVNPTVAEGMRLFIGTMIKNGLSEEDITCMIKTNPARLLGLI